MSNAVHGPIQPRLGESFGTRVRSAFVPGPRGKTCALVGGAVVLWASWPALAILAHPAPPFLVLGLSALVGFALSLAVAAGRGEAKAILDNEPVHLALSVAGDSDTVGLIGVSEPSPSPLPRGPELHDRAARHAVAIRSFGSRANPDRAQKARREPGR